MGKKTRGRGDKGLGHLHVTVISLGMDGVGYKYTIGPVRTMILGTAGA